MESGDRARVSMIVLASAALLTACAGGGEAWVSTPPATAMSPTSASPSTHWTPPPDATRIPLPLSDWTAVNASSFALSTHGVLLADGDCIRLREQSDGSLITPVWPAGHTAYKSDGVIVVVDPQGYPVARTGESVDFIGGYVPATHPDSCTKGQSTFEIQEDIRRGY